MDDQRIQEEYREQENEMLQGQQPGEEARQADPDCGEETSHRRRRFQEKRVTREKKGSRRQRRERRGRGFLHFLQHASLVTAVILIATLLTGSYFVLYTDRGVERYSLLWEDQSVHFEDSELFNQLLGKNLSDLICYGAIRSQMETQGVFDPRKEIDVTAFAGRYGELPTEYITARYYLDDLLKWGQSGLEYEDVFMSGEEVGQFLSSGRTVTKIDPKKFGSGAKYLNSDLSKATHVVDVSGNLLDSGEIERDNAQEKILKNKYYTTEGKNIEDYVCSWEEYHGLCANLESSIADLQTNYNNYLYYKDSFDSGDSNIVYFICKTIEGKTEIYTNMETEGSASQLKAELEKRCGRYLFYDASRMDFETNTMIEEATLRYLFNGYEYAYPENTQVMIGVDLGYAADDCFAQARESFGGFVPYLWQYLAGAVVCILIYVLLLALLTRTEGQVRRRETGEIMIALHGEEIGRAHV